MARITSKLTYPYTVGGVMLTHGVNDFEVVEDAKDVSTAVRVDGPRKITAEMFEAIASNPLTKQRIDAGKLVIEGAPRPRERKADKDAERVKA